MGGAGIGNALDNALNEGLPRDELFVYQDALRQGRTVVLALTSDDEQAEAARQIFIETGAESVDAARRKWWLGLRDVEKEHYEASGQDFSADEPLFRQGFEAALKVGTKELSDEAVKSLLNERYSESYFQEAFRRGCARGLAHRLNSETSKSEGKAS